MKNRFSFSGLLLGTMVLIAVFMSSCGSKAGYEGAIPSDAPIVMEINMESLTFKSNILSYKDEFADQIVSVSEANETAIQMADALRKMDDGGLNFHNPLYVYTTKDADGIFLLASVRSKDEVAKTVLKLGEGDYRVVEDEKEGCAWIEKGSEKIGAFNEELVLIGKTSNEARFAQMIHKEDAGFFGSKMGRTMKNHAGDMTLMLNAQNVNEQVMAELRRTLIRKLGKEGALLENDEVWDAICKVQMVLNLKFSVGEVSLNLYAEGDNSNAKALTKVNPDVFNKISSEGMLMMAAIGLDGEEIAAYFDKEVEKAGASMDNETRMGLMMIGSFVKAMNGTAAFCISNEPTMNKPAIVGMLPIAKERSQYLFNLLKDNMDLNIYLTGDDQYSVISNIRSYQFGNVRNPLSVASHAESCYMYMYLDLHKLLMMLMEEKGRHDDTFVTKIGMEVLELVDYAEMKMESYEELSLILKLRDDSRNSLDLLLKKSFDLGMQYLQFKQAEQAPVYDDWDAYDYPIEYEELEEVEW